MNVGAGKLSRQRGGVCLCGVTVVQSANHGRIRLGIEAPPEVIVLREELTRLVSMK